jgi:hypothetical protein
MPIKHVKTEITGGQGREAFIWMRLADSKETEPTTWAELKIPIVSLSPTERDRAAEVPGHPQRPFQIAALRHVRDALAVEIERLSTGRD